MIRITKIAGTLFLTAVATSALIAYADEETPSDTFTNSVGLKLVRIESGVFTMGEGEGRPRSEEAWQRRDWDESPAHQVRISNSFHMSAQEVTNAQYEKFAPQHKDLRGAFNVSETDNEPVTMVSWQDAVAFCQWLSEREGRPYRLPTEAEWEYACRAGKQTKFSTGEALTAGQANIGVYPSEKKRPTTLRVGSYDANPWGLFDMHGNVAEWCIDGHGPYAAGEQIDPIGPAKGYARVVRGGSYSIASWKDDNAHFCRSSNRAAHLPEDANRTTGFRVVLSDMPRTKPLRPAKPPLTQRNVKQVAAKRNGLSAAREPYFDDFRDRRPTMDCDAWGPIFSKWNHFTACCVCPNGDVLAAWYTTKSESGRELAQAASRLPAGSDTWQPASLFFDVADVNDHAPVLLCDGERIYHFASQSLRGWDDTSVILRTSDDSGATWSHPRIISRREGPNELSQSCSAFVADDGTVYLAVDGDGHRQIGLLASSDRGKTWNLAGRLPDAIDGKRAIHPAIAPGDEGRIVAFLRGPDPFPRLISNDGGKSWKQFYTPFAGINVGQKAATVRLTSGKILLVAIDAAKPPVTGTRGAFAAISADEGRTWQHVRSLPNVGGYLSAAQAPDGVIYVFGSRLSCVAFNEAWLTEGQSVKSD